MASSSFCILTISKRLHRDVTIQQLRINPYAMSIAIRGFSIKERNGSATERAECEARSRGWLSTVHVS